MMEKERITYRKMLRKQWKREYDKMYFNNYNKSGSL